MPYRTKLLDCWDEVKTLRLQYYENYVKAPDRGALRWGGSAWAFSSIPEGLEGEVYSLTGEPYGASVAYNVDFARQCWAACEARGMARDLCAYMRNYWGSILINKFVFGGEWPTPDFHWTTHICCSHAKWYQVASELEEELYGRTVPTYAVDPSIGPYTRITTWGIQYVVEQLEAGIEWLQKVTGRKYDDEKLIEAVYNECRATSLWAEICCLNKAVPAPLGEKTMFSLYVLSTLMKEKKECAEFYEKLRDEVKDRVENEIAEVEDERFRLITYAQPPWAFLKIWRYLEREYGAVCVGSPYTFGLIGMFEVKKDGTLGPKTIPKEEIKSREAALWTIAEWTLHRPQWLQFYDPLLMVDFTKRIVWEWKVDGVILHYNRGCEGLSVNIAEVALALKREGIPVMTYEGNMGDEREVDFEGTLAKIDTFMDILERTKREKGK